MVRRARPRTKRSSVPAAAEGYWKVPRMWEGGTCYILGGGPSLSSVDLTPLEEPGRRTIGVNAAYSLGSWFDVLYWGDEQFLNRHWKGVSMFNGLRVTTCPKHLGRPGVHVVRMETHPHGIARADSTIRFNNSSGGGAIGLAVLFGVARIVLLGYDMQWNGAFNWHDLYNNKKAGKIDPKRLETYNRFRKPFLHIADDLKQLGIECINATPGSALDVFPIVEPSEVL